MKRVALAALWLAALAGVGSEAEPLLEQTRGLFARGRFVIGSLLVRRGGSERRLVVHLHYRGPAHLLARVKGSPRLEGTGVVYPVLRPANLLVAGAWVVLVALAALAPVTPRVLHLDPAELLRDLR